MKLQSIWMKFKCVLFVMECQTRFLTARFWNWLVSQSHTTQQIPSRRVGILNYLPISHYRRWWNQPVQYDKIIMSFALQKCRICLGSLTVEPEWNKWCARNIWNFCNRWKHLITSTNRPLYACFNHGRFVIFWIAPIDIFDVGNTGHCIHKGSAFVVAFVWTDVFVRSPTK